MSIICPNCRHEEIEGAFFCSECATMLITNDGLSTVTIKEEDDHSVNAPTNEINASFPPTEHTLVNLYIVKSDQMLPLVGQNNFSIGRVSKGQSIIPDIDLTPFKAFSQGVSRLHAIIQIKNNQVSIRDLRSSNGTLVNKKKMPTQNFVPIKNGDIIMLGKFKIQAIIKQS
jgi:pSer/pThr/pTyr-binding forkhead associated (FHA) protein